MTNEFKKTSSNKDQTVYTLESASSGGTSSGSVASSSSPIGGMRRRPGDNLIAQEAGNKVPSSTPRNFVAKNAKTGGAGAHKDKKKEQKQGTAKHKKPYMESFNGEYDDEAGMAHTDLHTIARAAQGLLDTIDDKENLPEWAQEKLAKVEGMLVAVWDYLKSQEEQGIDPRVDQGVAEGKKRPDTYHIVNKDGKPATLASYADKESAVKDRDAKHQGAEVRQLGPRGKVKGVAEGFPQPGESSGKAKQFNPNAKVQTKEMTLDQILATVKGIPYVNNVVDDWDAKDYSWGVTKKVIEYAQYLQKNPQSVANLPPLVVIDGQLNDGAHRLSAINLLQKRMDPKNPLWKQVKLKVNFGTSADVASEQGVAEGVAESMPMNDAVKVLRQYGADHFKTTSNELHFYKNGRPLSVDLIFNSDATRSVSLSQLNSVARQLKGQGVAEGLPQTLRKVVPGYAKREIDKKMDAGKFGKTDADKDANFQRYKKIQDKLKEFAPDGFNGSDDGEEFNPRLAKMAYDEGVVKGVSLADGATTERAMAINDWDKHDGGMYKQYFAKGFKAGRMDKIRHDNKQYNLNLKLMKDGSIRHGEQGVAEGSEQQWVVTVGTKTGGTSHTMTFSGTKEQAIKQAVARFGTSKNPVVTAKPKQQGVAEGDAYMESLQAMVERQLEPTMDLDTWNDNFQNADPQKYHQFKNKSPEKKK